MSNANELLLRTLVAPKGAGRGLPGHMEEIATVAEARPAVLALVHEGNEWRRAGPG
jgi:hypothetical protein